MPDAKRTQIKKKVAAGQARNRTKTENTTTVFDRAGEAAIDAKDKFTAFAKQHPIATVAGGLAIGILIAGMFKAPRRRADDREVWRHCAQRRPRRGAPRRRCR